MANKSGDWQSSAMDTVYGLTAETIAERTGVDVSTARRWKAGSTRLPRAAQMIIEADLGCFGKEWRGWRIQGTDLVSPEGWKVSPGEIMALPLLRAQIAAYKTAERVINEMDDQPMPGAWENVQIA